MHDLSKKAHFSACSLTEFDNQMFGNFVKMTLTGVESLQPQRDSTRVIYSTHAITQGSNFVLKCGGDSLV